MTPKSCPMVKIRVQDLLEMLGSQFSSEAQCQAFFNFALEKLFEILKGKAEFAWRDTSVKNAPSNPLYQFDLTFVRKDSFSARADSVVAWTHVISFIELKSTLDDTQKRKDAQVQVSDGFFQLYEKQSYSASDSYIGRQVAIAAVSDGKRLRLFSATLDCQVVVRTDDLTLFDFKASEATDGFCHLIRFLLSPSAKLGFVMPDRESIQSKLIPRNSLVIPHRVHHASKPDIFFIHPPPSSGVQVRFGHVVMYLISACSDFCLFCC